MRIANWKFKKLKLLFLLMLMTFSSCEGLMGLLLNSARDLYWQLEVTTTATDQDMTIGLDNPVDMIIEWGDETLDITNQSSITHTYATPGVYILKIKGQAARITFENPDAQARLTNILSVVQGIEGLKSFESTFAYCTNITSIPPDLFTNCPLVTNFKYTFRGCTGLTGSIPSGLFDKNPLVTSFIGTFRDSTGLSGAIPAGLFDNNPLVTSFAGTFNNCTSLTSIPAGLFDYNTQVIIFYITFQNCSGLTGSIPTGLFDNCPLVVTFNSTFSNCSGLTSIPSGLFDNNPQVGSFSRTFEFCTSITSAVPELWVNTAAKFPNLGEWSGAFSNVTSASNYNSIDPGWN